MKRNKKSAGKLGRKGERGEFKCELVKVINEN